MNSDSAKSSLLEEVANIEVGNRVTRYDRIKFRFTSLYPKLSYLSSWEADFIRSTLGQFNKDGDLTDKQFKVLLRIWQQAHHDNLVSLPKGMV